MHGDGAFSVTAHKFPPFQFALHASTASTKPCKLLLLLNPVLPLSSSPQNHVGMCVSACNLWPADIISTKEVSCWVVNFILVTWRRLREARAYTEERACNSHSSTVDGGK
jgi:hypothetical protein